MKILKGLRNKHVEIFGLLILMYVLGAILDAYGYINWTINVVAFVLEFTAVIYMIVNFVNWTDSGVLPARRAFVFSVAAIALGVVSAILCSALKMRPFILSIALFTLFNIIMTIISMYKMTRIYFELLETERKEKSVTKPKIRIRDIIEEIFF